MTDEQILYLDVCLEKVKAEKEVFLRSVDTELSPDRIYHLTLELTGDEEQAEKRRAWRILETTRSTSYSQSTPRTTGVQ